MTRFILLCLTSFSAFAQTTVPPPPASSGIPSWVFVAGAIFIAAVGGYLLWSRSRAKVKAELQAVANRVAPGLVPAQAAPAQAAPAQAVPVPPATSVSTVPIQAPISAPLGTVAAAVGATVTLPATGHVLPVARSWDIHPDGESFAGYALRVYKECGATDAQAAGTGDLVAGGNTEYYFRNFGGYQKDGSNWPQAADAYYNPAPYLTSAERDYAAALLARDQAAATKTFNGPVPVGTLTLDDKLYLYASAGKNGVPNDVHYRVLSGTSLEIREALKDAGSSNTALAASYDVGSYNGPLKSYVEALKTAQQ